MKRRIEYIDWIKSIGMLLVVWGHSFPEVMSPMIYAINLPIFFIVSGMLSHDRHDTKTFYRKIIMNLLVPYLLLSTIKGAGYMIKHIADGGAIDALTGIVLGFHTYGDAPGCLSLWFIYTTMLTKILCRHIPSNLRITAAIVSLGCAFIYSSHGYELPWAIPNTMIGLPLFIAGNILGPKLDTIYSRMNKTSVIASTIMAAIAVWITSTYNGDPRLYRGYYGNNLVIFISGAAAGFVMVYLISRQLEGKLRMITSYTSIGSMVTLAFHRDILYPMWKPIVKSELPIAGKEVLLLAASATTLLCFVPITMIVEKYLPIFLGERRIKSKSNDKEVAEQGETPSKL